MKKIIDNLTKIDGNRSICLTGVAMENCQGTINSIIDSFSIPVSEIWQPISQPVSISEVRNLIRWLSQAPISGKNKIAIVPLDEIKHEAANALLKTLEEPPKYAIIVATIKDKGKLLPTIQSRLQVYYLAPKVKLSGDKSQPGSMAIAFSQCAVNSHDVSQAIDNWLIELEPAIRQGEKVEETQELLEYKMLSQLNCNQKILLENAFLARYEGEM